MATGQDARPTTAADVREIFDDLRAQQRTLVEQQREALAALKRIAAASEDAAARLWWIALPIYVVIITAVFTSSVWIGNLLKPPHN